MKQNAKVEIGQHYQSVGAMTRAPAFTYRVTELFQNKFDKLEYARLVQVGDPSRTKSIAASVLLSPRHFLPVAGKVSDEAEDAA